MDARHRPRVCLAPGREMPVKGQSSGYPAGDPRDGAQQADVAARRFLVAALMLFVAKGDGNISDVESGRMIDLLASRLKISYAQSLDSLTRVLNALQDDGDIAHRLRDIAAKLTSRQKREVFAMMLDVAAADEVRDDGETEAIDMASRILGMSPGEIRAATRDFAQAAG